MTPAEVRAMNIWEYQAFKKEYDLYLKELRKEARKNGR